jgi:Tfp pilus assembly protein PilO
MKEFFEKTLNTLKRFLTNEAVAARIYLYWGAATLIIFGIFGFWPVSKVFFSNIKLLDEMYQNNLKLEKKIVELKDAKVKLDIVGDDADILDEYLPNDFEPQTYLVEISSMAGKSGYSLDRVSFGKIENSRVSMSLSMSGNGDIKKFVQDVESSGKITEISSIELTIGDREDQLIIPIESYIMEK